MQGAPNPYPPGGRVTEQSVLSRTQPDLVEAKYQSTHARKLESLAQTHEFVADAVELLGASLDYEATLRSVAHLAVRSQADLCIVDIVDEAGVVRRLTAVHANPEQQHLADALREYPASRGQPHLLFKVLETHRSEVVSAVSDHYLQSIAQDPRHLELLRQARIRSHMIVPLIARGRQLGVITFISSTVGAYGPDRLRLAELLAAQAALAIDNARLYRDAQLAIHARDEVLAVVSHDLGNELNTVFMATELLLHSKPEVEATDGARKYLTMIRSSALRMERLVHDLLDVHRLEAGHLQLDPSRQVPQSLIVASCRALEPLALVKSVALDFAPSNEPVPYVHADPDRIVQVLSNLIGNAIKFTPMHGRIVVSAAQYGAVVRFSVSDTGPGLSAEQCQRVFDRFWQASQTGGFGIGLGLSIAKGLVEAHGGEIWAESVPGQGATFSFTLPIAAL